METDTLSGFPGSLEGVHRLLRDHIVVVFTTSVSNIYLREHQMGFAQAEAGQERDIS